MKKRIAAIALAIAALLLFPTAANADEDYMPTVYIADGVWYKDKSQPLITDGKDGFFIPIDAFGALPGVNVKYDNTAEAIRLTCGDAAFSADLINGTVISPDGDISVSIIEEHGTFYLNAEEVCSLLRLEIEPYFYSNGKRAVRINDGSGSLEMDVLVRMFVSQKETLTRMEGVPVSADYSEIVRVADAQELEKAAARLKTGELFTLAIDAELILSYGSSAALSAVMAEVYASGIPVSLYAFKENNDTVLHYVHSANARLMELMHKGINLCTPTAVLSENDLKLIVQRGFMITNFTFEEAN